MEQTTSIVNNSVGFVPYMDGKVTIRTKTDNAMHDNTWNSNRVTFTIKENGSGIPSEKSIIFLKNFIR
jgi:signal transduction histidine kinase